MKLDVTEKEKSLYKKLCWSIKDYDKAGVALLVDIRRFASALMQSWLDNQAYS